MAYQYVSAAEAKIYVHSDWEEAMEVRRDCQYLPEGEQVVQFSVRVRTSAGCLLIRK